MTYQKMDPNLKTYRSRMRSTARRRIKERTEALWHARQIEEIAADYGAGFHRNVMRVIDDIIQAIKQAEEELTKHGGSL